MKQARAARSLQPRKRIFSQRKSLLPSSVELSLSNWIQNTSRRPLPSLIPAQPHHSFRFNVTMPDDNLQVAIPSRSRSMKGWVMLSGDEIPQVEERGGVLCERNILPSGTKRSRAESNRSASHEASTGSSVQQKVASTSSPSRPSTTGKPRRKIHVGVRARSKEYHRLEREITRLKTQNDLLATAESDKIKELQDEVERLKNFRTKQNKVIERQVSSARQPPPSDTENGEDKLLQSKEYEIERQKKRILELESSLDKALGFEFRLSRFQDVDMPTTTANFERKMKDIELGIIRAAELLHSCLYPLDKMPFPITIHPELGDLIKRSIKDEETFHFAPNLAFRALLFCIVRDSILHSDMWTALHMEGHILRGYQNAIQDSAIPNFLPAFHKAAVLHALEHDASFKSTFLSSHADELQSYTMALFDPLLDPSLLQLKERDLLREMGPLFRDLFSFRAQCFAPDRVRFEVLQFSPGDRFDPDMMEAQDKTGMRVGVPERGATVKLCVHGTVVAHRVQDKGVSAMQKIKLLSQPFLSLGAESGGKDGRRPGRPSIRASGEMLSDKAIVILND
ncbi:uncharacterized protein BDV17DRAFT_99852 [Aspergillus undulatus]|uniref:uncharacterized protein n=1 Tax=Aspergillus undulatus TaxID=1810928 RepID=UPI003CCE2323